MMEHTPNGPRRAGDEWARVGVMIVVMFLPESSEAMATAGGRRGC